MTQKCNFVHSLLSPTGKINPCHHHYPLLPLGFFFTFVMSVNLLTLLLFIVGYISSEVSSSLVIYIDIVAYTRPLHKLKAQSKHFNFIGKSLSSPLMKPTVITLSHICHFCHMFCLCHFVDLGLLVMVCLFVRLISLHTQSFQNCY